MSNETFSKNYNKSKELCFDENEFLKDSFSVDTFLREHRNKASLEIMRDDLGTHLKTLRLAMIELINKDYEDFVNLSKDLVGLDDEIRKIQTPLEQIRNEVLNVKNDLDETISGFKNCLEKHKEITDKKQSLIHVTEVITCMEKLDSILNNSNNNNNNSEPKDFSLELIERATMEFNQLQFSISKCECDLLESQKKQAESLKNNLMDILNNKFLKCLKNKNSNELVKCLRIYAGLDMVHTLELLVRNSVVAPKLNELITEVALQREPDRVGFIYSEIIKFVESELLELLELTTHKSGPPVMKGYNFLINSFWPELEKRLDLPLMFAPGNPKLFHSRFTKSVELIEKLERLCGNCSAVLKLRQNEHYQHFFQKWNLPVYFKIRFQEIAGQLEKVLDEEMTKKTTNSLEGDVPYSLKSSVVVLEQLQKCWRSDIFLSELAHMFWKLSLQIISRYTVWMKELLKRETEAQEKRKSELASSINNPGTESFFVRSRLDFLVCLYSDTNKLLRELRTFLEGSKDKIPNRHLVNDELSSSLNESLDSAEEILPMITGSIVKVIVSESAIHFRQVSQIPRLFRRTNRKSSTEPCEYIGQILSLPRQFHDWKKNSVSEIVLENWLTSIFNELTEQFYTAVNEVLTNAQKTEESLRRLKKKKDNYSNKNSGDDEIRQQLVIDVHSFCDGADGINVKRSNVKMLKELVQLVETARDQTEKQ